MRAISERLRTPHSPLSKPRKRIARREEVGRIIENLQPTGRIPLMQLDVYTFQHWDNVESASRKDGLYVPSWQKAEEQSFSEDGDSIWWDAVSPAYRWVMREMENAGMFRPNPDATPVWAWARWVDSHHRVRSKPDRRCKGFHSQYVGLDLMHLRVDEHRILLTDFDQYHAALNNVPCPRDPINVDYINNSAGVHCLYSAMHPSYATI